MRALYRAGSRARFAYFRELDRMESNLITIAASFAANATDRYVFLAVAVLSGTDLHG